jgi:hypothetical protein
MLNLKNIHYNDDVLVYINTMDSDIPYTSNLFLFGFKNGFTHKWSYVIPDIIVQNTRYTKFGIDLVKLIDEDPENGKLALSPDGNWDYKLWAIDTPILDPTFGYVIDEGQMYLDGTSDETQTITYISNNEAEENIVYLSNNTIDCLVWNSAPDQWNLAVHKWSECN